MTLTLEEAKERFGKLTYGSGKGAFSFLEFDDAEGHWIPQYDDALNLMFYKLQDE